MPMAQFANFFLPAIVSAVAAPDHAAPGAMGTGPSWAAGIVLFPLIGVIVCGLMALMQGPNALYGPKPGQPILRRKAAGLVCIAALIIAFLFSVATAITVGYSTQHVTLASWLHFAGFKADIGFYLDPLTSIMLLVVTGIGSLVAIYASEYMFGDRGYARFFSFVSLFIVAMTCLVLGDNLLFLYLGWEGVGLCSYLLIGFYYEKPEVVAAAKKAFIVTRIGDFGFIMGIMLTYMHFGTIEYAPLFAALEQMARSHAAAPMEVQVIPFLLLAGAIGKSAQLPLYVWLPDAMEGPTPVSALIHAATMVTAGVYMIARLDSLFVLSPYAMSTVAWMGGLTAFFAATIGMAHLDIKRVFAYSTISQLGYMFMGLGVATTTGAVFHLMTHAFFKALLFLCCGAIMHGFAGQLDIRKLSGLRKTPGWQVVTWTMLCGCLALAGFPLTSGFFSKDTILAQAFVTAGPGYRFLGWLGLLTAGLTAYYTFRVFFRVFMGPEHYEPGEEAHGSDSHHFHPHAPGGAINFVLIILAIGAIFAGWLGVLGGGEHGWFGSMMEHSTAHPAWSESAGAVTIPVAFWSNPHHWMMLLSSLVGLAGIAAAWYLHLANRPAADSLKQAIGAVGVLAERKWCIDEGYDIIIRKPLRGLGHACYLVGDTLIINGLVALGGATPRLVGAGARRMQRGFVQTYAIGMAGGAVIILAIVWWLAV